MKSLKFNQDNINYSTYQSPFSLRYGSEEMRKIWSEENKRLTWRKVWAELAKAQSKIGLISKKELKDILENQNNLDIKRSREIEKEIYHDVMSEIKAFAEKAKIGGGKIHLGATSMDITDNADIILTKQALKIVKKRLKSLINSFAVKIEKYKNLTCMGYTHLQPAEPTTLGYRLSFYAQDLLIDLKFLKKIEELIKGKGIKGAVGTSASYKKLLSETKKTPSDLENEVMKNLGIEAIDISGQTYPRKIDLLIIEVLVNIAASLNKFNFDLRIMQSPQFGEWSEPRSSKRVGSSAMPFKKNPDKAEKVCSLCRYVSSFFSPAWANPAMSLLERTLDDSAAKRIFLPESFLAIDECLKTTDDLVSGLTVFEKVVKNNLERYGLFSATESVMMEASKKGADRQEMHELIRELSMKAWEEIQIGKLNPLKELILKNKKIKKYLSEKEIERLLNPNDHIGNALEKTENFLKKIKPIAKTRII